MNRQERRALDRQVQKSIYTIREHLDFLNSAGNPKYKLVVQSNFSYRVKSIFQKAMFWK